MNEDYEKKRNDLLLRQTQERLATDMEFKRHHDYIERLKGRDPGRGTELLKVLTVVRHLGGCYTSEVGRARALPVQGDRPGQKSALVLKLEHLAERGLIARQTPLQGMGVGAYESRWTPERTETWNPR